MKEWSGEVSTVAAASYYIPSQVFEYCTNIYRVTFTDVSKSQHHLQLKQLTLLSPAPFLSESLKFLVLEEKLVLQNLLSKEVVISGNEKTISELE